MQKDKKFFLVILGSALEYYDFVLYGLLATHISKTFFPVSNHHIQLIQSLSIFALGYLVRPIAGTLLGIIADRYSNVKVFSFSMLLMGMSTFLVGLLPSYEQWGMTAPILLVFLRIAQGISFSAEIPGSVTILSKIYANKNLPNFIGSLMSSTNFGFILASLLIYLVHLFLSDEQVSSWGWRIPFIIGGFLAFVSYYVRRDFGLFFDLKEQRNNQIPIHKFISEIAKSNLLLLLRGIGITSLLASGTMFFIYLPHFLGEYYRLSQQDIRFFFFIGLISFVIFGKTIKYSILFRFFMGTVLTFPIVIYLLLFQINLFEVKFSLFLLFTLYEMYMAALFTSGLSLLSQLFPLHLRNTCISLCYNFSFSVFSLVPALITYLATETNKVEVVFLLFLSLAIISIMTFLSKKSISVPEVSYL